MLDLRMPGVSGLQLQAALGERQVHIPIIFISGNGDIAASVRAMKAGAVDFIEKPCDPHIVLQRVNRAMEEHAVAMNDAARGEHLKEQYARLTPREREVLGLVVTGKHNKDIARCLNISYRTVEIHRSNIFHKLEVDSLPALITKAIACGCQPAE